MATTPTTTKQQAQQPTREATERQPQAAVDPNAALLDSIMERTISNLDAVSDRFAKELNDPLVSKLDASRS